jgi:hypothetical protein
METTLRYFGYSPYIYNQSNKGLSVSGYFWIADKRLGFRNRPNGKFINTSILGSPLNTTDDLGYRNTLPNNLTICDKYIIFLGDSTIFSSEVSDFETGPSEVAKLLKNNKMTFNVINAGVRGFNTLQSKRMLEETLGRFKNSLIAIYVYCDNDLVENLNPIVYFPVKAPIGWIDKETGQKTEIEVERQIVPWGQSFYANTVTIENVLIKYISYSNSSLLYQSYILFKYLYNRFSNKDNVKVMLEAGSVGPVFLGGPGWNEQLTWAKKNGAEDLLVQLLIEMNNICKINGVKFITTRVTTGKDISNDDYYKNICQKAGVNFVSIVNNFNRERTYYMARIATRPGYDGHYNQNGTRAFAKGIFPIINSTINLN